METLNPTVEDYMNWYKAGLITIFPLMLGSTLYIIVIPINN